MGSRDVRVMLCLQMCIVLAATSGCLRRPQGQDVQPPTQMQPLTIGIAFPLTGKLAAFGQEGKHAVEMAVAEVNAAGGVGGAKVVTLFEDTQGDSTQTVNAVRKLVSVDKVLAVVGEVASTNTLAAAPICQKAGTPLVVPASTNVEITKVGDYVSRVCFLDSEQGVAMANFAMSDLKAKTAGIMIDAASDYSVGLADAFKARFQALGGNVKVDVSYTKKDQDFLSQLTKIKSAKPDLLFLPGDYAEVGLILRQARQLDLSIPVVGGDAWSSPKLFEIAGQAADGCYITAHFSDQDTAPEVGKFVASYQAKYGAKPSNMSALAYDSIMLIADAIRRAPSSTHDAVKTAINATSGFQGVTGTISLNSNRNPVKPIMILKTAGGKFEFVKRITPVSGK